MRESLKLVHGIHHLIIFLIFPGLSCSNLGLPIFHCPVLLFNIVFQILSIYKSLTQIWNMNMVSKLIKLGMKVKVGILRICIKVGGDVSFPTCHSQGMFFKSLNLLLKELRDMMFFIMNLRCYWDFR